jgi:uncharacterized protein (DUF1015 family)
MPSFHPFRGLRYDTTVVELDDVIAPPYDVIGAEERAALARRSPCNAVRLELPEPDDTHADRYEAARGLLDRWRRDGCLRTDARPALYPYRMTTPSGDRTTGIMGALGLPSSAGEGDVLPHEETLPKARSDRLDLLRATGANLSPIWGLSMAHGLTTLFDPVTAPLASATDADGVRHELWVLDDPEAIGAVGAHVASAPVVIADGHHRFETAFAYRGRPGIPGPADAVMAFVVELAPEQLHVRAIHRTLEGLAPDCDLLGAFGARFTLTELGARTPRVLDALDAERRSALVLADTVWALEPRADAMRELGSDLDTSLVAAVDAALPAHHTEHRHSREEALRPLEDGTAQAAVLLRPVRVDQIEAWARARRRMPPKSTLFVPKPRTGMVMRLLADDVA